MQIDMGVDILRFDQGLVCVQHNGLLYLHTLAVELNESRSIFVRQGRCTRLLQLRRAFGEMSKVGRSFNMTTYIEPMYLYDDQQCIGRETWRRTP